jgi:serine/threonine protein kinase
MGTPRKDDKESAFNIVTIPYVSSKTELKDLKSNQKLYDAEEIATIKSLGLREGRTKSTVLKGIDNKDDRWDVIRSGDNYYAIYKGKEKFHLGSGSYGFTKLAQDLETGDWLVLKVIDDPDKSKRQKKDFDAESKGLQSANQLVYSYEREIKGKTKRYVEKNKNGHEYSVRKTKHQFEILMKLAPGVSLLNISESERTMPTARWLDLGISALESVKNLHDANMLHCDLSRRNMMYDYSSRKITPIDFGLNIALKTGESEPVERKDMAWGSGNVYYMAPECANGFYSRKSDVFSLGIMLADMYNLGSIPIHGTRLSLNPVPPVKIQPELLRLQVTTLVRSMISDDPAKRPTVDEALNTLKKIRSGLLDTPALLTRTGYLSIQEYNKANNSDRERMIETLKKMDEVFLVDEEQLSSNEYINLKRVLEREDIIVRQDVIQCQGNKSENIIRQHVQQCERESKYIHDYTYIMKKADKSVNITPYMMSQKVVKSLDDEVLRLKRKYNKNMPDAVSKRITSINFHRQQISILEGKNINYENIQSHLQKLQDKLLSTNAFKRFFEKKLGFNSTESLKIARELGQEVKNANPTFKPK